MYAGIVTWDFSSIWILVVCEPGMVGLELVSNKRYKLACAPIEDSDQPVHPQSPIRIFDGHSMGRQGSNISSGRKILIRLHGCTDPF